MTQRVGADSSTAEPTAVNGGLQVRAPETAEAGMAEAQAALAVGNWEKAATRFAELAAHEPSAPVLDGLASAYFWLDHPELIATRERAYRAYRVAGDVRGAARQAIGIAFDLVTVRGEDAVAQGWLDLAERLLAPLPVCADHGVLAVWQADYAITIAGDTDAGLGYAHRAADVGRELENAAIELLGLSQLGLVKVLRGDVEEGMRLLQASAAAAVAGDIEDRALAGFACCYLISACDRVHDFDRAAQWCQQLDALCARIGFHALQHFCRAEYAGVLVEQGDWPRAEEEMRRAAEYLGTRRPPMAAEATVRLAELRRRQGRLEEAERLFAEVEGHPRARLGMGALSLDRGEAAAALAWAERFLRGYAESDVVPRAAGLELEARARIALGDLGAAALVLEALRHATARAGREPLVAAAVLVAAELHMAKGEIQLARQNAEDAMDRYLKAGSSAGVARARAVIARAVGAGRSAGRGVLTAREVDVLRLVAQGLTNAAVAQRLVLSEHTVHRHLSNAMNRLGVKTRAAAVARASDLGLL